MNDVTIIDRFLDTFSRYIDSGFGLRAKARWRFLTITLIAIDMTIAGQYPALGHASGQGDDVIAKWLAQGALYRRIRLHHQQLQLAVRYCL